MEISGDWGEPGESQVKSTFCRNLLKIAPTEQLTHDHFNEFTSKVKSNIADLQINPLSAQAAEQQLKTFTFNFLGKTYELFKTSELNKILRFSGSNKFLHAGQYGKQMEFIFGSGTYKTQQGYDITIVKKEHIRTPNNVMSMAAIIGHQNIYIRLESLKTIFSQKWLQVFDYTEMDMLSIYSDPFWNIAEGIKQNVLDRYDIKIKEDLIEKETVFIDDMSETILYHELGHGIIQNEILPFELGAIGEATKIFGENIYTAILEFLADFSPKHDDIMGPIQNIIAISKKDRNRAIRMYLMYMSDTWFYNTEDTYMYTYSDMMTLILIKYITPDNDVNFEKLEQDLVYHSASNSNEPMSHFDRIIQLYISDVTEIKTIVENATFSVTDQELSFKQIQEFLIGEFQKNDGFVHTETYEFLVPFWTNVLGYVQKISNSNSILMDYIEQQQTKTLKKLLILSCGKETAKKYDYDHRKYIIDHMTELQYLAIDENIV